jgi:hypothetical protein
MPSPFPGMDPYLEGPLWTTLHLSFAMEIVRQLGPKLGSKYLALPAERFVMDIEDSVSVMATPVPHVTIEIRDVRERQLVTAIEILSPTNKIGEGHREYLAKRQRLLLGAAHLLEVDLLRRGKRPPMHEELPSDTSYFVFLSRVENRPLTDVWPIDLSEPLPTVPVPLLGDDGDVPLDLQAVFSETYDVLRYDLAIDYGRDPDFPLPKEKRAWLKDALVEAGKR